MLSQILAASIAANVGFAAMLVSSHHSTKTLLHCPIFDILTRQGIDRRWKALGRRHTHYALIMLDIDWMHDLNAEHGYPEVNRRIRSAMAKIRQGERFRWFSGDEIGVLVSECEAAVTADRVLTAFKAQGISVTGAIVGCSSSKLAENADRGLSVVQQMKEQGKRGEICADLVLQQNHR